MDKMYWEIKEKLLKRRASLVMFRERELFDEIVITMPRAENKFIKNFIYREYKNVMKLRVESNDRLIYTYMNTTKEKYDRIKNDRLRHQERFKWLYAQIKDEDVFLKNAKITGGKDGKT